jgi:hypothetical protein
MLVKVALFELQLDAARSGCHGCDLCQTD